MMTVMTGKVSGICHSVTSHGCHLSQAVYMGVESGDAEVAMGLNVFMPEQQLE